MADSGILAIDQGTTSSRAVVFDGDASIVHVAQQEFPQIYPADGWVEHDPEDIWNSVLDVARQAITAAESRGIHIAAIGVTNQRETTLLWDRATGEAIHNAIVWQDRRTADRCKAMREAGHEADVQHRTGLLLDPYFSASKVAWLLKHVDRARAHAQAGDLAFGTVDSFLVWRLTGGQVHATDATNASRTGLYNIRTLEWDPELLSLYGVPESVLPEVRPCNGEFGATDPALFGRAIPILGMAGDQQAAAIGQGCFAPGDIKSTYGTGAFVLVNTGDEPVASGHRLLTTVGAQWGNKTTYALEGSIFVAGAAVQWLRDGIGVIRHAADTEGLARGLGGNSGIYLVPAFTGLGAPHWDPTARGALFGLTRATGPRELARAALESVAYQTSDLLRAMADDGVTPSSLRVDGGMVTNDWLVQFLANIVDMPVVRPAITETTALGAAYLAGLHAGLYPLPAAFAEWMADVDRFEPAMDTQSRLKLLGEWQRAVARTLSGEG